MSCAIHDLQLSCAVRRRFWNGLDHLLRSLLLSEYNCQLIGGLRVAELDEAAMDEMSGLLEKLQQVRQCQALRVHAYGLEGTRMRLAEHRCRFCQRRCMPNVCIGKCRGERLVEVGVSCWQVEARLHQARQAGDESEAMR